MRQHQRLIGEFAVAGEGHLSASQWLTEMARNATWGDQLSLLSASEAYQVHLAVATLLPSGDLHWTYYPREAEQDYHHLYHTGNHYEILFPVS